MNDHKAGATAKKTKENAVPNKLNAAANPKEHSKKGPIPGSDGNTTDGKPLNTGKKSAKSH